jgi:hypothetical protein
MLFTEGSGYSEPDIAAAIEKIVASDAAEREFQFVLNRCCHILINRWQTRPQHQPAIADLIAIFELQPSRSGTEYSRARFVRRLRSLVKIFVESEQYTTLRRLAQVTSQAEPVISARPIGSLIRRYPYLYEHCLISEGSTPEQQDTVRDLQMKAQRQYEIDLSHYVTYQVRRSQLATLPQSVSRSLHPVKNPTLLSDAELNRALRQFIGKTHGAYTYRDCAQQFLSSTGPTQTFHSFKDHLYDYLTLAIDPEYGKRQFNQQLQSQLQAILPESHPQKLNDFLLVRTCSQLLNFLVVESARQPQHYVFVDLIANLGATSTTGLLLKIVLICRKVRPYLEKRFSILFNHYESCTHDTVRWFVQMMETLNVALCTNFSPADLSLINQVGTL